eukprot:TRINITY_DN28465_c0_g1_i1.p1 TRINITY_DN28465_c0_g1~~TRINITY_DN28465_c0_g1_i1.p1  ORF type:complete len:109 (+),score=0.14 TRINITY_DN28465_c0_g1_i1:423-749(+)
MSGLRGSELPVAVPPPPPDAREVVEAGGRLEVRVCRRVWGADSNTPILETSPVGSERPRINASTDDRIPSPIEDSIAKNGKRVTNAVSTTVRIPVSYTHLTLPTKRIV